MLATGLRLAMPPADGVALLTIGFAIGSMLVRDEISLAAALLVTLLILLRPLTLQASASGRLNGQYGTRAARWRSGIGATFTVLLCLALALHAIPGFQNPLLSGPLSLSDDSASFSLYASLDKGFAAFALLALVAPQALSLDTPIHHRARLLLIGGGGIIVLLSLALVLGIVRWDPKLPVFLPQFIGVNLLITCVAEEALFRGILQEQLQQRWLSRNGQWLAILLPAGLFGLMHLQAGTGFALLAILAGSLYGYIYQRSRYLPAAVLCHALLNLAHLLMLSYPRLL